MVYHKTMNYYAANTTMSDNEEEQPPLPLDSEGEEQAQVRRVPGKDKWKPSDVLRDKVSENSDKIETIVIHLQMEAAKPNCTQLAKSGNSSLRCNCLRPLEDPDVVDAVANGVMRYILKTKPERHSFVMLSIRYSKTKRYFLPFANPGGIDGGASVIDTMATLEVCQSALMTVLGIGRRQWNTCKQSVESGIFPSPSEGGTPSFCNQDPD